LYLLAPLDGVSTWSCWGPWSECSATCGGTGNQMKYRVCIPGNGSQTVSCPGTDFRLRACGLLPCPPQHCPNGFEFGVQ